MNWNLIQLEPLLDRIWAELQAAPGDLAHPFRTPVLGTATADGCALRTVVLRQASRESRQLVCHTDGRSAKTAELRRNPRIQWLFHHPQDSVQVRVGGRAAIHHKDLLADEAWRRTPLPGRMNYCTTAPPGTMIMAPADAWPDTFRAGTFTVADGEQGRDNFAVIVTVVERLEWLELNLEGHRRAVFEWTAPSFFGRWVVP